MEEILLDRGRVIAAALTIVRAYICAGCPSPAPRLASFEEWSDTVRSALIWLGCADPVETMELARAEDQTRETLELFMTACRERYGDQRFKVAELMRDAQARRGDEPIYPGLAEPTRRQEHGPVHRAVVSVRPRTVTAGAGVLSDCYRSDQILTRMKGTSAFVVMTAKAARPLSASSR
jgi:hypothetical protein